MHLQSGEVAIKSPKTASIDADFISKLPDILLIRILSFLPAPDAYRTCILSKRWNNICSTFPPNLRFVMDACWSIKQVNMFYDSLDQTLAFRGGLPIHRFSITCSRNNLYNRVYDVFCKAGKIEELELTFPADKGTVTFYQDLIETCSSVVSLTLSDVFVSHMPDAEVLFPCLKKLVVKSVYYADVESISKLISGCPVLEELTVKKHTYMGTFRVSSPYLKRLSLSYVFGRFKIAIDAPKLEYLYIWSVRATSISVTEPLSLAEAHIKTPREFYSDARSVECFSSVKILTLAGLPLGVEDVNVLNLPVFPHLVKFVLKIKLYRGKQFLKLLNRMPNLEHITFADGCLPYYSTHTRHHAEEVPACLHFKIKEIIIQNEETITEFGLIRYLLKYSNNLEKMMINAHKIDATTREQLMNFHCGSSSCRIEFV